MNKLVSRYYTLKNKQKLIDQELSELKQQIVDYLKQEQTCEAILGSYKVKLVSSERKEYEDVRLYEALPDKELWRLLPKPDLSKINGLIKMGVLTEDQIKDTYVTRTQQALHVEKK